MKLGNARLNEVRLVSCAGLLRAFNMKRQSPTGIFIKAMYFIVAASMELLPRITSETL